MTEHIVKTHPVYFDAVKRGDKRFEIRRDDRGYQKGDILVQQRCREDKPTEVDCFFDVYPMKARHELRHRIGWILTGGQFGIEPGFVIMQLEPIEYSEAE